MSYITIKITALENSDYNVIHYYCKNNTNTHENAETIEIGRPKNIAFNKSNNYCIKGKINEYPPSFILILKDDHFAKMP
jgi:hypothetical protein